VPSNASGAATRHVARLGDVSLIVDESLAPGIAHLVLAGCESRPASIAGLCVTHDDDFVPPAPRALAAPESPEPVRAGHGLVGLGVDHVVVLADDVRATCAEIERASGAALKRVRESERGVQGFHRLGSVILEVVERRLVDPDQRAAHATYWGLVVVVDDIDAAVAHLGPDVIGAAKPAVQPGRRIATVRPGAGLGVPLALMSR
jgi:hypothetical protein